MLQDLERLQHEIHLSEIFPRETVKLDRVGDAIRDLVDPLGKAIDIVRWASTLPCSNEESLSCEDGDGDLCPSCMAVLVLASMEEPIDPQLPPLPPSKPPRHLKAVR